MAAWLRDFRPWHLPHGLHRLGHAHYSGRINHKGVHPSDVRCHSPVPLIHLKINKKNLCGFRNNFYFCSVRTDVLATPLSAGSKAWSILLHFKRVAYATLLLFNIFSLNAPNGLNVTFKHIVCKPQTPQKHVVFELRFFRKSQKISVSKTNRYTYIFVRQAPLPGAKAFYHLSQYLERLFLKATIPPSEILEYPLNRL